MRWLQTLFGAKVRRLPASAAANSGGVTFRAIGIAVCRNPACTYQPDPEIMAVLMTDPGPEFTIQDRGGMSYVVCASCGAVERGPISTDDAMKIVGLATKLHGPI